MPSLWPSWLLPSCTCAQQDSMVHAPQGAASAATIENVPGEWRQNSVARSLRADSHASNHSNRSIPERSGSSSSGTRPGSGQPHVSGGSDPALLLGLLGPLAAAKPSGHGARVAPAPPPPPPRCHTQAVLLRFARRNNWTDHRLDMVSKLVGGSAASQIDLSPQQRHLSAFDSSSLRGRHSEPLPKPGSGGPSASAAATGRGGSGGEATEDVERRSSSFSAAQAQFQRPGSAMESVAEDPLDGASAATPVVLRGSESAPQVVEAAKPAQGGGGKGGPDSPLAHRISLPMMPLPGEHIPAPLPPAEWPAGGRGTVSEAGMSAEFSGYPKQPALARLLVRLQKQAASGELLAGGGRPGGLGTSPRGGPKAAGRTTLSGAEGTGGAAVPSGARTRRMSAATYPSDDAPSPSLAPSPFAALSGAHSRSRRLSAEGPGRASPGGLFAVAAAAADATSALARSRSRRLPMASPDEASAPAAPASDVFSVTAAAADVTSALARSRSRRLPTANAASDVLAATAAAAADATSALARSRSRRLPTASATSDVFSAAAAVADTTSASARSRSSRLPAVNTRAGDAAAVSASADAALAPHQALGVSTRSRIVRWQSEAGEGEGGGGRSRHVSDTGAAGAPERESSRRSGSGGAACSVSRASSMSRASSITSRSSSCVRAGPARSSGSLTAWSPLHPADWAAGTPTHGSGQPEERTSRSSIIRKPRASCAAAADRASTSKKVSFQIAVTAVMAAAALSHHQPVAAMEKLAEEERAGGDAAEAGSGRAAADATVAGSG